MKYSGNRCIGIIKHGYKNLFIQTRSCSTVEIKPLCILDFYVHESVQRGGHGRALYEQVLARENVRPHKLAYDRPSIKYRNFLQKFYGLSQYVEQNNNFVVFDDYFEEKSSAALPTTAKFHDAISPNLTKTTMMSTALGQGNNAGFTKYHNATPAVLST